MVRIATLKRRAEFQRVRGGSKSANAAFLLEGKARVVGNVIGPRFGFTVTKKLGGAVQRNLIRRRLRAALAETMSSLADNGFDYVIVARPAALDRTFTDLKSDFETSFKRIHAAPPRTRGPQT